MGSFWPFMASFWGNGAFALFVPLLLVHYSNLGFGGVQIGILAGLPPVMAILGAPLWTSLADRTGRHQRIWGFLVVVVIVSILLLARVEAFVIVLLVLVAFNIAASPFPSLVDTSTMYMLGDHKERYGRIRVGATVGFALFAYLGGVLAQAFGVISVFYAAAAILAVAWFFIRRLEFGSLETAVAPEPTTVRVMLRQGHWWVFIAIGFAGGIGFALVGGFFYPFMGELGAEASTIGLALFIGTISEVPVLFLGSRFLAAMRPFTLLVATVVFTGLRFVAMSFLGSAAAVMALQATHGLTFVLMWVAAVAYADAHAPADRKTTAQGIFSAACLGAGAAAAGLIGGPILAGPGAGSVYLVGGLAITTVALVAGLVGRRLVPRPAVA